MTFADGVHRLTATATDAANLVSPVSSQFTVNVIPDTPVISAVLPVSGTSQRIEVQGTGEVGETIKLFADGSTTVLASGVVDATGHFDIFANILGGAHIIRATETNAANLVSLISSGVSVNVTPNAPADHRAGGPAHQRHHRDREGNRPARRRHHHALRRRRHDGGRNRHGCRQRHVLDHDHRDVCRRHSHFYRDGDRRRYGERPVACIHRQRQPDRADDHGADRNNGGGRRASSSSARAK